MYGIFIISAKNRLEINNFIIILYTFFVKKSCIMRRVYILKYFFKNGPCFSTNHLNISVFSNCCLVMSVLTKFWLHKGLVSHAPK